MKTLTKGKTKKIFIETKTTNITDIKAKIFNLEDNSVLFESIPLTEIEDTCTYFFELKLDIVGYFLLEVSSETTSEYKIRKVIRVTENDLLEEVVKTRKLQTNKAVVSSDNKTVNIYDDDGTAIIHSFDISADKLSRTPK